MANLDDIVIQKARPLPVIILADVSGSMHGEKIDVLNNSVKEMISSFSEEDEGRAEIQLAVITFGNDGAKIHQELKPATEINWVAMTAEGRTPMGAAFEKVTEMIEDKKVISGRAYAPTIVLLSDGIPTDNWQVGLEKLHNSSRAKKAMRLAMIIGNEGGKDILQKFINDDEMKVFEANEAREIQKFFRFVTMSVSVRSRSTNPNQKPSITLDDGLDDLEF